MMADHGKQDVEFWYRGKVTRRRLVGYGAGALGATMLVPAPWLAAFGQAKPVKIGTLQPLSGAAAAGGKTSLVGVQMAVDRINKAGGVNGRPIELIIADALEGLEMMEGDDFPLGEKVLRKEDHQAFNREFIFQMKDGKYKILEVVPKEKTMFPPACKFA
jgi:hypothetical protein